MYVSPLINHSIMIKPTSFTLLLILAVLSNCTMEQNQTTNNIQVIPAPSSIISGKGFFNLNASTKLRLPNNDPALLGLGDYFSDLIRTATGFDLETTNDDASSNTIIIELAESLAAEGYHLEVTPEKIHITAQQAAGAFYAIQTLRQLLPAEIESQKAVDAIQWKVPVVTIQDAPRFSYRGLHLDVGRHFFPVEFIYKFIDLLALHKMNRFHWHLTEDQGWRIEIKKYPKLQEISAFRDETLIGHYNDQPHQFDGKRYGGYYSQEEIRKVVAYAESRFVTVIPEIEMPGHSLAVLAAYPELACHEGPFKTGNKWGIYNDVFCPTEATFEFLENVILEVIELFPNSPYIHIGGDETPKLQWKNSAFCQQLIKEQGLKDEHGLQSYFIQRMEKFINSKGKQIIGWDEILEGGLAPNATVMSWQGIEGGIAAARQGHDVIMSPTSHCYFDYYQSRSDDEPLAIGGYIPLDKVYNYEPIPEELTEAESKHILGAQGNLWTEYIPTGEKAEYMVYPRAIALAEVVWSQLENKDYDDFAQRLSHHFKRLDELNVNYANHILDIESKITPNENGLNLSMTTIHPTANIRFTTDGSEPSSTSSTYNTPLVIANDQVVSAAVFEKDEKISRTSQLDFKMHKAAGKTILLETPPAPAYSLGGKQALINGIRGSSQRYGDGEWLGWSGADLVATIDLGASEVVNSVQMRFFNGNGQWIYLPKKVVISLSEEGENFKEAGTLNVFEETLDKTKTIQVDLGEKTGRFLRVQVERFGLIPDGLQGGGHEAWLFVDEIEVN